MRIVVVANKYWEADPLVGVLTSDGNREGFGPKPVGPRARPRGFTGLDVRPVLGPDAGADPRNVPAAPRLGFRVGEADVEVWALQDLMDPTKSGSLSVEKHRVLGRIFEGRERAAAVIAVGTAAAPAGAGSTNPGSVVAGRRFLIHDGDPAATLHLRLPAGATDTLLESGSRSDLLGKIPRTIDEDVQRRFVRPPAGQGVMALRVGDEVVSIGTINIVDYSRYRTADPESLAAFEAVAPRGLVAASVETTHGLIGLAARERGAPFAWVSGIANPVGAFDDFVGPREYAQNFAAAHNAGVAVAWMLPAIANAR
jgi:hypothetical protein